MEMAQVQADTLHDDVKRIVVADQFATDWLLVAENDYESYRNLLEMEEDSISRISDQLRENWENLTADVVELVEKNISPVAGLFIAQMLQGQGSLPFDIIARHVISNIKEEVNA